MAAKRPARRSWLFKSEPGTYSIDDLARDGRTSWEGVRNYQARNLLRDELQVGDPVLFYHSSAKPLAIVGLARVVRSGYPDPSAADPSSEHHDPAQDPAVPRWYTVDLEFVAKFAEPVTRDALLARPELAGMMLLQRGSRLSVQPVTDAEWRCVLGLAGLDPRRL